MNTPVRFTRFILAAMVASLVAAPPASLAANHLVESIDDLRAKIKEAGAGDVITVKSGTYLTNAALTISGRGAEGRPITIAAEKVGDVEIAGTHGFSIVEPAAHIVISGFKFTHAAGRNSIGAGTSHVRFTRNTFQCTGDGAYLSVIGDDAQVDHNEFRDKKSIGSMLAVGGTGSQVARRLWVHHNYFHDFAGTGGAAAEMLRFGLTALAASTGTGLVEHNLFVRCRGENELVSNRSSGNTYRFNTVLESPSAQFTLRHGNACVVYGNYFHTTEGLRIYGDRHHIYSNYFEANYIGVNLGNGSTEVAEGGPANGHDRPDHCVIVFNTFVDNRTHYQMSRRTPEALGATNTTFANNVLAGRGIGVKVEGPYVGAQWSANLIWTAAGAGDIPAEGYAKEDPLLAADAGKLRRPQPGSPALESAVGEFPWVNVDIDGQFRPAKKSRGADEPGNGNVTARVLTEADVGPLAPASAPLTSAATEITAPTENASSAATSSSSAQSASPATSSAGASPSKSAAPSPSDSSTSRPSEPAAPTPSEPAIPRSPEATEPRSPESATAPQRTP